jgi:hypothetical protein
MRRNVRHASNSGDARAETLPETLPKRNNRDVDSRKNYSNRRADSNNSRDAYNSRNSRNVGNTRIRRDVTAIGTAATAETLPTAGTPRMPTAVKTAAVAGTPAVA